MALTRTLVLIGLFITSTLTFAAQDDQSCDGLWQLPVTLPREVQRNLHTAYEDFANLKQDPEVAQLIALQDEFEQKDAEKAEKYKRTDYLSFFTLGLLGDTQAYDEYSTTTLEHANLKKALKPLHKKAGLKLGALQGKIEEALHAAAKSLIRTSLIEPPPQWAAHLVSGEVEWTPTTDGLSALVRVFAHSSPKLKVATQVFFDVLLVLDNDNLRGAIMFDHKVFEKNEYSYDAFAYGTVIDGETKTITHHRSIDHRIFQLHLHQIHETTRHAVMVQMAENKYVRRQVSQVLNAMVQLRRSREDNNVPISTRTLLTTYFQYWSQARFKDNNMLTSPFLLAGLTASEYEQQAISGAILRELNFSRARHRAFSPYNVRDELERRLAKQKHASSQAQAESDSGDWFWIYYWHMDDPCRVPADAEKLQDVMEANGRESLDSKEFIESERAAHPDSFGRGGMSIGDGNDTSVQDGGRGVETPAAGEGKGGDGGGDGGNPGDGDGGGGD